MKLEKTTLIANFYERNRMHGPSIVKRFLRENGITIIDARVLRHAIRKEINEIQDLQDEQNLIEQIAETGDHEPKHVEVIIGREFIKRTGSQDIQDVLDEPDEMLINLDLISKVAYKYQLKYALIIFDVMVDDEEIWETVTLH